MNDLLSRRRFIAAAAALVLSPAASSAPRPLIEVWKGPGCECCDDWVAHLKSGGFDVKTQDSGNSDARARLGMPERYGSCHTGRVGRYAIEGHVPVREIRRLLREKPAAIGLAVPAMPIGSPGMDGPQYGDRRDPYDVLLVGRDGAAVVYRSYRQAGG